MSTVASQPRSRDGMYLASYSAFSCKKAFEVLTCQRTAQLAEKLKVDGTFYRLGSGPINAHRKKDEKMSERCSHCHRATNSPCSSYSGRARVQALQSCTSLPEVDRCLEAAACEGASQDDRELAICIALTALCGGEQKSLRRPCASAIGPDIVYRS